MNNQEDVKIGLISCGGEELAEGTLSRAAVRLVLEELSPQNTVTICLPLFLAGDSGERTFAQKFPTIIVDGCDKLCAYDATQKYSGKVDGLIIVSDLLKEWGEEPYTNRGKLDERGWRLARRIAEEIVKEMGNLSLACKTPQVGNVPRCSCGGNGC